MDSEYKSFLLRRETIGWAWRTARRMYEFPDGLVDVGEIAEFDLNLEAEIDEILSRFISGTYTLDPIKLLPQPKKSEADGTPRMRQSFHISVRDQVAWIAVCLSIGPYLDSMMPSWSYGHRLFKAAWYEETQEGNRLALGPYRHTSGLLYRKFKHSWPLFRRHISLTSRMMVSGTLDVSTLNDDELSAFNYEDRPPYLQSGYWPTGAEGKLYYASFDLEKFYPKVKNRSIQTSLEKHLPGYVDDKWLSGLVASMLEFTVSADSARTQLSTMAEPSAEPGPFRGIPTGLMVAGFLSNVALLPVDLDVESDVEMRRRLAHFRFVDDHAVLAYDFNDLVSWIRKYDKLLLKHDIGPRISPDKYDPENLKAVIAGSAKRSERAKVADECSIDGTHPTKLMTRTLALVSTLAAADFNTMPGHAKEQRLGELEWLLLADLPDREIRADTRAAFAAGRIASIVPTTLGVSAALLGAVRRREGLKIDKKAKPDEQEFQKSQIEEADSEIASLIEKDQERRLKLVSRYFFYLFKAFEAHPDKPRVLLRVIEFCRATGYDGVPKILDWIEGKRRGSHSALAAYLRLVVVQSLSRQIVICAYAQSDSVLLERERRAAASHLANVRRLSEKELFGSNRGQGMPRFARNISLINYRAALAAAAAISEAPSRSGSESGAEGESPSFDSPSSIWQSQTKRSIGVWAHWAEQLCRRPSKEPAKIWIAAKNQHDPRVPSDWSNLRKYPEHLPGFALRAAQRRDFLHSSDGGWLLEALSSSAPSSWLERRQGQIHRELRAHLAELNDRPDMVTLSDWVAALRRASPHDPRASEWTALQIIHLLLAKTAQLGTSLGALDDLHPANILIPRHWLEAGSHPSRAGNIWTWESWRRALLDSSDQVLRMRHPVHDYRRQYFNEGSEPRWDSQFKGIGLLLLGLLRRDFSLPPQWNLRGHERELGPMVRRELEELAISSFTHGILEAALLPRSRETRTIMRQPLLFFGERRPETVADTRGDAPVIRSPAELREEIVQAQAILVSGQISVLDHAPRQLVPMDVFQLGRAAAPLAWDDEE